MSDKLLKKKKDSFKELPTCVLLMRHFCPLCGSDRASKDHASYEACLRCPRAANDLSKNLVTCAICKGIDHAVCANGFDGVGDGVAARSVHEPPPRACGACAGDAYGFARSSRHETFSDDDEEESDEDIHVEFRGDHSSTDRRKGPPLLPPKQRKKEAQDYLRSHFIDSCPLPRQTSFLPGNSVPSNLSSAMFALSDASKASMRDWDKLVEAGGGGFSVQTLVSSSLVFKFARASVAPSSEPGEDDRRGVVALKPMHAVPPPVSLRQTNQGTSSPAATPTPSAPLPPPPGPSSRAITKPPASEQQPGKPYYALETSIEADRERLLNDSSLSVSQRHHLLRKLRKIARSEQRLALRNRNKKEKKFKRKEAKKKRMAESGSGDAHANNNDNNKRIITMVKSD